jgi:hypothetical protein
MDQMAADQDLILTPRETSHKVLVPHGIEQGLATHTIGFPFEVEVADVDCSVKEHLKEPYNQKALGSMSLTRLLHSKLVMEKTVRRGLILFLLDDPEPHL